jgi:hypothetical protein
MQNYSGDFIPSLEEVQSGVFKQSLFGPFIHDNLGVLLINSEPSPTKPGGTHH